MRNNGYWAKVEALQNEVEQDSIKEEG